MNNSCNLISNFNENLYNFLKEANEKQIKIEVTILEIKTENRIITFYKIFVANDKKTISSECPLSYSIKYSYVTRYKQDFYSSANSSGYFSSLESMYLDFVNKYKI